MTRRAILWCGHVRPQHHRRDAEGRIHESEDALLPLDDFKIQVNGLELAFGAARALGVAQEEIHACLEGPDLAPQQLTTPLRRATVADLAALVESIAQLSTPEDVLLFVAVNHGTKDGYLVTADPVDEFGDDDHVPRRLTPDVLGECLQRLGHPQVLVVATCFAGAFLTLGGAQRAVVTACSPTEVYRVLRVDGACSEFLSELFGAWCATSHADSAPPNRMPLDRAFACAKERLAENPQLNVPHYAGTNVWR